MPISSYHRLTGTSTCKPWNTTTSQRRPRSQSARSTREQLKTSRSCRAFHKEESAPKTPFSTVCRPESFGANDEGIAFCSKGPKERVRGKESSEKRARSVSATLGRTTLKRRETFPTYRPGHGAGIAKVVASSKRRKDSLIRPEVSKWKQVDSSSPKRTAWGGEVNQQRSAMKLKERQGKVSTAFSSVSAAI